jgi:hypothetical protein
MSAQRLSARLRRSEISRERNTNGCLQEDLPAQVAEKRNFLDRRHQFVHDLQAFRYRPDSKGAHARHIAPWSA